MGSFAQYGNTDNVEMTHILFRSYVQHPRLLELGAGAELDKLNFKTNLSLKSL